MWNVDIHICKMLSNVLFCCCCLLCEISADLCFERSQYFPRYFKIKGCHKSSMNPIGVHTVDTVHSCAKFAREKKGLAFNFSPPEAANISNAYRNCEILSCPEMGNSSTLVMDLGFDYYSAYGNFNTTENATCIKSIGVFSVLPDAYNYTESIQQCQSIGADLADIMGEYRTLHLANLINSTINDWFKAAYVGLDDLRLQGQFENSMGYRLRCTKFRAWGPNQPRHKHKDQRCVILDAERTWKVVQCKIKLPALCEFYPEEPLILKNEEILKVSCSKLPKRKERKTCRERKKFIQLFNKSSRIDKCALSSS